MANEQIGVGVSSWLIKRAQNLRQLGRAELARSTRAVGIGGQSAGGFRHALNSS